MLVVVDAHNHQPSHNRHPREHSGALGLGLPPAAEHLTGLLDGAAARQTACSSVCLRVARWGVREEADAVCARSWLVAEVWELERACVVAGVMLRSWGFAMVSDMPKPWPPGALFIRDISFSPTSPSPLPALPTSQISKSVQTQICPSKQLPKPPSSRCQSDAAYTFQSWKKSMSKWPHREQQLQQLQLLLNLPQTPDVLVHGPSCTGKTSIVK